MLVHDRGGEPGAYLAAALSLKLLERMQPLVAVAGDAEVYGPSTLEIPARVDQLRFALEGYREDCSALSRDRALRMFMYWMYRIVAIPGGRGSTFCHSLGGHVLCFSFQTYAGQPGL